jgi:hypothetical protein
MKKCDAIDLSPHDIMLITLFTRSSNGEQCVVRFANVIGAGWELAREMTVIELTLLLAIRLSQCIIPILPGFS